MTFYNLNENEVQLVTEALIALRDGPWLAGEFSARIGMELDEYKKIVSGWPKKRDGDIVALAIRAALREVALGIRFTESEWSEWFSASREEFRMLQSIVKKSKTKTVATDEGPTGSED